jgi:hypothetical protein
LGIGEWAHSPIPIFLIFLIYLIFTYVKLKKNNYIIDYYVNIYLIFMEAATKLGLDFIKVGLDVTKFVFDRLDKNKAESRGRDSQESHVRGLCQQLLYDLDQIWKEGYLKQQPTALIMVKSSNTHNVWCAKFLTTKQIGDFTYSIYWSYESGGVKNQGSRGFENWCVRGSYATKLDNNIIYWYPRPHAISRETSLSMILGFPTDLKEKYWCAIARGTKWGNIPAKWNKDRNMCWYAYGGKEYTHDDYYIACGRLTKEYIGSGQGWQNDGAGEVYCAVANTKWGEIPGKAKGKKCWYSYGGNEYSTDDFWILSNDW